jgi:hypothetical protein
MTIDTIDMLENIVLFVWLFSVVFFFGLAIRAFLSEDEKTEKVLPKLEYKLDEDKPLVITTRLTDVKYRLHVEDNMSVLEIIINSSDTDVKSLTLRLNKEGTNLFADDLIEAEKYLT